MTVFSIILGVLLVISGFSMIFTPLMTFLGAGYFIIILFFIAGVYGVINAVALKRYGVEFYFALVCLILGVLGLVIPGTASMNNHFILYFAAIFFIIHGVINIMRAFDSKKAGAGTGQVVLGVILGILEIVIGIYSIVHPIVLAVAIGYLIAFYFIECGFSLIFAASAASSLEE